MINKKRLILVIVIFAALLAYIITSGGLKAFFENSSYKELKLQKGVSYRLESYKNDILLINNEELIAVKKSGETDFSYATSLTEPGISVNGDYILITDLGGTSSFLYKKNKLIKKITMKNNILAAKVNKKGYSVIATEEVGYKGMFTVFTPGGREIFKWHSGSGYIADVDISAKNKIIASQISVNKDNVSSRVLFFNIKKDKEIECIKKDDELIYGLHFYSDEAFSAVSESALYGFSSRLKNTLSIDYGERVLENYNINNKNNLVLCFAGNINNTVIENYTFGGTLKGSYSSDSGISSFDVSGELTAISAGNSIYVLTSSGKIKHEKSFQYDISSAKFFTGRKKIFVLTGSKSLVYSF